MPILTSSEQIRTQLAAAFGEIESAPLIVHSDLVRIGFVPKGRSIEQQLADWLAMLLDVCGGRTLLFPTFNYDYATTGRYRPESDPGQVGALNEYVRQQAPDQRTLTPIFNFAVLNRAGFPLEPSANAFDDASAFGQVRLAGGGVVFLGAGPDANTFIHHVEEAAGVPYRYPKSFPGRIETGSVQRRVTLLYRVRPAAAGSVEYDWHRLANDLRSRRVLRGFPLGNARLETYRAQELYSYWLERLEGDEHFLLTEGSRRAVNDLYAVHGKPLTCLSVEGEGRTDI
jgi:aminoglycoside N3'-acetyltransferase